jgi:hypothetical protein
VGRDRVYREGRVGIKGGQVWDLYEGLGRMQK